MTNQPTEKEKEIAKEFAKIFKISSEGEALAIVRKVQELLDQGLTQDQIAHELEKDYGPDFISPGERVLIAFKHME